MNAEIDYFETRAVEFARTLPMRDARRFLCGMLAATGHEDFARTREAFTTLCIADDQLELIASGQLKLKLGGDGK